MQVVGYVGVSTSEQASSGAGLEAQRRAIIAECKRRGWHLVETLEDAGYSARDLRRPGIQEALKALEAGKASALVVAKLDRLSRSMLDFSKLMANATQEHWALVALDVAVDTSTPSGEAMANMLATFSQFERRLISQRTKEALAVKKAQGVSPPSIPAEIARRIVHMRSEGMTLQAIAGPAERGRGADRARRQAVAADIAAGSSLHVEEVSRVGSWSRRGCVRATVGGQGGGAARPRSRERLRRRVYFRVSQEPGRGGRPRTRSGRRRGDRHAGACRLGGAICRCYGRAASEAWEAAG